MSAIHILIVSYVLLRGEQKWIMRKKDFSEVVKTIMTIFMTMMTISIQKVTIIKKGIVIVAVVMNIVDDTDAVVIVTHTITIMIRGDVVVAVNPIQNRIDGVTVTVMDIMEVKDHIVYAGNSR